MNNKFIVVEGLDGSGKTTVALRIIKYLNNKGIKKIFTIHEPGGTLIAEVLRVLIKYGYGNEIIDNISELLMIYTARRQLLERVVKPALSQGYWIVGDRYDLSSHAYQGGGRKIDITLLHALSKLVTENLFPDLTFYLDIDPNISLMRIKNRNVLDRIEHESLNFFKRVRSYYKKLILSEKNVVSIDASLPLEDMMLIIYMHLDQCF